MTVVEKRGHATLSFFTKKGSSLYLITTLSFSINLRRWSIFICRQRNKEPIGYCLLCPGKCPLTCWQMRKLQDWHFPECHSVLAHIRNCSIGVELNFRFAGIEPASRQFPLQRHVVLSADDMAWAWPDSPVIAEPRSGSAITLCSAESPE